MLLLEAFQHHIQQGSLMMRRGRGRGRSCFSSFGFTPAVTLTTGLVITDMYLAIMAYSKIQCKEPSKPTACCGHYG